MQRTRKNAGFKMAGTEGTFEYKVPVTTPLGRLGYRNLSGGQTRVRIEPANAAVATAIGANFGEGWKRPGGRQFRFSVVTRNKMDRLAAIAAGLKAIGALPGAEGTRISSKAPKFVKKILEKLQDRLPRF